MFERMWKILKRDRKSINLIDGRDSKLEFEEASFCPVCHAHIVGKYLFSVVWGNTPFCNAAILFACTACNNVFMNTYNCEERGSTPIVQTFKTTNLRHAYPNLIKNKDFDKYISDISPTFSIIYNQAMQAESEDLDQIAGIGYRKAVEFLVKDFAIHCNKNDEEKIKNMALSNCIKEYVDDPRIKSLAEKATWIGNDETHYVRKHEDKDITDMKRFIDAMVYFISMVLITEDADSMQKA